MSDLPSRRPLGIMLLALASMTLAPAAAAAPLTERAPVDPELPDYLPPRGEPVGGEVLIEVGDGLRSLAEALVEGFEARSPGIDARVVTTGSAKQVEPGSADRDTATVSLRLGPMIEPDVEASRTRRGEVRARVTVAREAVIPIVTAGHPLTRRGLSLAELDGLYSARRKRDAGRIRRWEDLGLGEAPGLGGRMVPILVEWDDGLVDALRRRVLLGAEIAEDVERLPHMDALIERLSGEPDAIGVATRRDLDDRVDPVPVRRGRQPGEAPPYYLPTARNIESLRYPLVISLNLYFDYDRMTGEDPQPQLLEFLRFALSRSGQAVFASAGHYPLSVGQIEQQLFELGLRLARPGTPGQPAAEPVSQ